jgi:hypothetical protein
MKTKLTIEVDVDYPTIVGGLKQNIELKETRSAIDLVITELKECFRINTSKEFTTIGNANVKYDYTCDTKQKSSKAPNPNYETSIRILKHFLTDSNQLNLHIIKEVVYSETQHFLDYRFVYRHNDESCFKENGLEKYINEFVDRENNKYARLKVIRVTDEHLKENDYFAIIKIEILPIVALDKHNKLKFITKENYNAN